MCGCGWIDAVTIAPAGIAPVVAQHAASLQGRDTGVVGRLGAVFAVRRADPHPSPLPLRYSAVDPEGEGTGVCGSETVARVSVSGVLELRRPDLTDDRFFLRNVTAGIFGGDTYDISLTCEAGASARVEPTSATKVYAMPDLGATSHVRLRADRGGRLVWGPHTTILHAESDYASVIEVELVGGVVIVAETVAMGRLASGEAFAFRRYDSRLTVRDEAGTVLFAERGSLAPSTTLRDAMAGRGALTTVYALGMQPDAWMAERLTDVTSGVDLAGWSVLPNGAGIVGKGLAGSGSQGEAFARAFIHAMG